MTGRAPARERGFTLVEILIVLAIIAALMGIVAAIVPQAILRGRVERTRTLVNNLGAELEALRGDEAFSRYPPTRTKDLRVGKKKVGEELGEPNTINVGIETVYFLLNYPDLTGHQVTVDQELIGNTDGDSFRVNRSGGSDAQAREFLDAFGNPLVYFHSGNYKEYRGLTSVQTTDGIVEVFPKRLPASKGGQFLGPSSFQVFSLGPNGKQDRDDAEDPDDIVYSGK